MSKKFYFAALLIALVAFALPMEHKYDKLLRFFSLKWIPQGVEVSPAYDKKIYFYPSDLIAIFLLPLALFGWKIPLKRFFGNALWIVLLCAAISIAASDFASYLIPYTRLLHLLTPIVLFSFLTTGFSQEEKEKATRWILMAIVSAGLLQTTIAIAQYFHQAPLGLRLLGEVEQQSSFAIRDGSRWLIDELLHRESPTPTVMRAAGTFPNANPFGGFMLFSILATYPLILQILSKKWKWALALTLPFQIFALGISYSRAALFGWGLANLLWFGVLFRKHRDNRDFRLLAAVVVFSIAATSTLLFNQYLSRGGVWNYNDAVQESDKIRRFHQRLAFQILKDHPFLGLGFTQFSERAVPYFPENASSYVRSTAPHNIFLFLACETGLISLCAFLSWIASLLWTALRSFRMTIEKATFLALFVAFLFVGCCDFYLVLFHQGILMLSLAGALLAIHTRHTHRSQKEVSYA